MLKFLPKVNSILKLFLSSFEIESIKTNNALSLP